MGNPPLFEIQTGPPRSLLVFKMFGRSKPPTEPSRRFPKSQEPARFLDLYEEIATQSKLTVPKALTKTVKRDKLDLRKASLTDKDVMVLAQTLLQLPFYGKINLHDNQIGPRGVAALVMVMKDHLSRMVGGRYNGTEMAELREVHLDGNPVSPNAQAMIDLHSYQEMITYVRMRYDIREAWKIADPISTGSIDFTSYRSAVKAYTGKTFKSHEVEVMMQQFGEAGKINLMGFESSLVHMLQRPGKNGVPLMPRMTTAQEDLLHPEEDDDKASPMSPASPEQSDSERKRSQRRQQHEEAQREERLRREHDMLQMEVHQREEMERRKQEVRKGTDVARHFKRAKPTKAH